jgi:hypothetical protein
VDRGGEWCFHPALAQGPQPGGPRAGASRGLNGRKGAICLRYRQLESGGGHVIAYQSNCSVQYMCQILMI